jgi:hypothetical protein
MIHNIKEDEEIINESKTHMMPLAGVINQGHFFQEMLPIHAQENPYCHPTAWASKTYWQYL